jgi:hypothetical protein
MANGIGVLLGIKNEGSNKESKSRGPVQDLQNKFLDSFRASTVAISDPKPKQDKNTHESDPQKIAQAQIKSIIEEMSESIHVFRNQH